MQSELGGLFYEMAIRDHVQMDVLVTKAAELQHLDTELSRVEHLLSGDAGPRAGHCESCGASRTARRVVLLAVRNRPSGGLIDPASRRRDLEQYPVSR